jgi:hypothetical protein
MKVPNIKSAEGMYTPCTYWVASGPFGGEDILNAEVEQGCGEVSAKLSTNRRGDGAYVCNQLETAAVTACAFVSLLVD